MGAGLGVASSNRAPGRNGGDTPGQARDRTRRRSVRRRAWLGLALVMAAHMAVAFFPYRLDPPRRVANGAKLAGGALTVEGDAVARTARPPAWLDAARRSGEFWLTLEARTLTHRQAGPAHLVAVESSYASGDLMVGQQGDDLTVNVRRPDSDAAGIPGVAYDDAFADDGWHEVRVVGHPDRVEVSLDGGPPAFHPWDGTAAFSSWDTGLRLYAGDAATGNRPWRGQLRRLEAGSGGIREDYLAPGMLEVPARIWHVPERVDDPLGWRSDRGRAPVLAAAHVLAFVPVGAFLAIATGGRRARRTRRGRHLRTVAGVAGVVGLAALLQLGKVFFDARHPALVDVAVMSAGGLAGYALTRGVWRRGRPARSGWPRPAWRTRGTGGS